MDSWGWALLLKPFVGITIFAVVFGVPMLLVWLLRPMFPKGRLKDFLFRERGAKRAGRAADPGKRVLNDAPLIRGELRDD